MQLREGEEILKVFHHHPTPFVFQILKAMITMFPFFLMLYLFQGAFSDSTYIILNLGVFAIFTLLVIYLALIYWLDKLILTNIRIVHVDWKYLTVQDESEARLEDIQDVKTVEKGILSHFWIFDYGSLSIDTSSSRVTLDFVDAPDPEGIRKLIYHVRNAHGQT